MTTTEHQVATLETIDLNGLINSEPGTVNSFIGALQSTGIFYLDFRKANPHALKVLKSLPQLYSSADAYFVQPADVKEKEIRQDIKPSQDRGYKTSDCDETFEISYDEILQGIYPLPEVLKNYASLYRGFIDACHDACHTMLVRASDSLQLHGDQRLEHLHLPTQPSDSGLKLIYEPTLEKLGDVQENKHTDSGTFTMLFYDDWGLHVQDPATKLWAFAAPMPGCALVNVADSLQRFSGNKFHSPLHRVTQTKDGSQKRYFLSYFLRPAYSN